MNKKFIEKVEQLNYTLFESETHEFDNSKIWSFIKNIDNYLIELHCNYPLEKEHHKEFLTLQVYEGQMGNDPPLVENGKLISYNIGQECIVADSDEQDFIENLEIWDQEAQELIKQFVKLTSGIETKSTSRDMGISAGFMDKLKPNHPPKKVGRNDPCPCGSGEKYKKCHGG